MSKNFPSGSRCAILGGNGSGKSTLLQIISGYLTNNAGTIRWKYINTEITSESVFQYVSLATPYLNLYDDFTLRENAEFFLQFKKFKNNINAIEFAEQIELGKQQDKQIRFFSSGMRQRVKLGLAILADTPLLILDEPTSHLDSAAIQWYKNFLNTHASNRSIFIASNSHADEIFICDQQILIDEFKGN